MRWKGPEAHGKVCEIWPGRKMRPEGTWGSDCSNCEGQAEELGFSVREAVPRVTCRKQGL